MPEVWRKLNRYEAADVAALVVGARVAARYFDPNGPGHDEHNMTTDAGVITRIVGNDPISWSERTVWLRPDTRNGVPLRWHEVNEIDYFGGDLYLPVEDEPEDAHLDADSGERLDDSEGEPPPADYCRVCYAGLSDCECDG